MKKIYLHLLFILAIIFILGNSNAEFSVDKMSLKEKQAFYRNLPYENKVKLSEKEFIHIIELGIAENDPEINNYILEVLFFETILVNSPNSKKSKRAREFARIPNLEEFLKKQFNYARFEKETNFYTKKGAVIKNNRVVIPPCAASLMALSAYFQEDDIEKLIIKGYEKSSNPKIASLYLGALGFRESLSKKGKDIILNGLVDNDPLIASAAAKVIEKVRFKEGLNALILAISRRDQALSDIVQAIAAYGILAEPYLPQLDALEKDLKKNQDKWIEVKRDLIYFAIIRIRGKIKKQKNPEIFKNMRE